MRKVLIFIIMMMLLCLRLDAQERLSSQARLAMRRAIPQQNMVMTCRDAAALARQVQADGYQATMLNSGLLTFRAPWSYVEHLSHDDRVERIHTSRRMHLCMDSSRVATGAHLLHSGYGLDCPYTGRGVLIGVLDQGFEYHHIAFEDSLGNSRLLSVWDRTGYGAGVVTLPQTEIPDAGDTIASTGHGTHVANICAGSRIAENDYYGIAPDASLVFISSELTDAEVMEDLHYISHFADSLRMPWVVNMSFGSDIGPHDGTGYMNQFVDSILSVGRGRQIVAAAGNEGNKWMHCSHTFSSVTDTVTLIVRTGIYGSMLDIWCQDTDSLRHLSYRPFIYHDGQRDYKDSTFWALLTEEQVDPCNKKHNIYISDDLAYIDSHHHIGVEIAGEAGSTIHAWTEEDYGAFAVADSTCLRPDHEYSLCDIYGCTHSAISVGSYNIRTSITSLAGKVTQLTSGPLGTASAFTSHGPTILGEQKPDVSAPGAAIFSAISNYGKPVNPSNIATIDVVWRDGRAYYYGAKNGTSMSSPMVAGVIALWLEANPNMTADEIREIIHQTSRHDEYTGDAEWDQCYGYGKIDAYEGLREALRRAPSDGVPTIVGSSRSISISHSPEQWRLLFGSNESRADILIADLSGHVLRQERWTDIAIGQEVLIPVGKLPRGTYILRVNTPNGVLTRKILR